MKALKIIGVIVFALLLILLVGGLLLPKKIYFEETRVIHSDPVAAFGQVNDLHYWEKWLPWFEMDPKTSITYTGPETGEGATFHWDGPVSGRGDLTILESEPYERVHYAIDFYEQGASEGGFYFEPVEMGTEVSWYMQMDSLSYPFERWMGMLMPMMMKKDFQQGLENIDKVLTK